MMTLPIAEISIKNALSDSRIRKGGNATIKLNTHTTVAFDAAV